MSPAKKTPVKGASLLDGQRSPLIRASHLARHDMLLMSRGTVDRARIAALVARGLLAHAGEAVHEETGRTGEAWTLTDKGRREVAR